MKGCPKYNKRIVIYSDVHSDELQLSNFNPDLVFLLGNISPYHLKTITDYYTCPILGVLGNHDRFGDYDGLLITDIHSAVVEVEGLYIAGFGGSPRYKNTPNIPLYSELDVDLFYHNIQDIKIDIFIAHSNPAWEPSNDYTDPHRGFYTFSEIIKNMKPSYFFHGHVHTNSNIKIDSTEIIVTYGMREIII